MESSSNLTLREIVDNYAVQTLPPNVHTTHCRDVFIYNGQMNPHPKLLEGTEEYYSLFMNLLDDIFDKLPSFDDIELKKSVAQFRATPIERITLLNDIPSLQEYSRSGDSIYILEGEEGLPVQVVKAFRFPKTLKGNFVREMVTLDYIGQKVLSNKISVPRVLAVGKCKVQDQEYGLIAMTYHKGKPPEMYLNNFMLGGQNLEEFSVVKNAYKAIGAALAALHNLMQREGEVFQGFCENALEHLNDCFKEVNGDEISQNEIEEYKIFFTNLVDAFQRLPFDFGYSHGDANGRNFLWDNLSDEIAIIDTPFMHQRMDCNREPIGFPSEDLAKIIEGLDLKKGEGLKEEFLIDLVDGFMEGYNLVVKKTPPQQQVEFYSHQLRVNRVKSYAKWSSFVTTNPTRAARMKAVYEVALDTVHHPDGLSSLVRRGYK